MGTIEYAPFRYDTAEVENDLYPIAGVKTPQKIPV